jgi:hypothetical protein
MDFVPVWLRTFVADTLRFIEYERRALPIALLCNDITKDSEEKNKEPEVREVARKIGAKKSVESAPKSVNAKPIKGHKPEPSFFFFTKRRREHFQSLLVLTDNSANLSGLALECELKKLASAEWKTLTREEKQNWKAQAYDEWKRHGGEERARLEAERLEKLNTTSKAPKPLEMHEFVGAGTGSTPKMGFKDPVAHSDRISLQAADAEGVRAMEQRILQVTQSLSRVGRVLDRHREEILRKQEQVNSSDAPHVYSPAFLRGLVHSPLSIMPDEHVIAWMWNHEHGIVSTLLKKAKDEICVSPDLKVALQLTRSKYSTLSRFGSPWEQIHEVLDFPMPPSEGRKVLNEALMEFRMNLLDGMEQMASDIKSKKASVRENAKKKSQQAKKIAKITKTCDQKKIRAAVNFVLNELVDGVEQRLASSQDDEGFSTLIPENSDITQPWLLNFNKRFKLEKAADLLLLYMRTSTFFRLVSYEPLKSSTIEVYARELGNEVPQSVVDRNQEIVTSGKVSFDHADGPRESEQDDEVEVTSEFSIPAASENVSRDASKVKVSGLCDPEDIVSEVVVGYQGDYVLSQLLQWYNAGLEQKPGLPDMLGCCVLPSMTGCWTIDTTKVRNSSTDKSTGYRLKARPRLVAWLKDPFKRGSTWPDELRRQFVDKDEDATVYNASIAWNPIGSPILDLLVTGDDFNVTDIIGRLGSESAMADENKEGFMSTVDHGRPAQAVSNWVQCENPSCQKWRKIPWHVDIDMLSKKFICTDNEWNKSLASCDAPEDDWDEEIDACVEADGSVKLREMKKARLDVQISSENERIHFCKLADFHVKGSSVS